MFTRKSMARFSGFKFAVAVLVISLPLATHARAAGYQIFVTNEKSGDITVINGSDFSVVATIPVGKRPRGIQVSPDGKTVYVALSGTPVKAPPQIDAGGNLVFKKENQAGKDDADDDANTDKSADGIGVIDVGSRKLTRKLNAGSDPEEFSLSKNGKELYISNEDVKTASVIDIATSKVLHVILVGAEPEGVSTSLDGKQFYVTCEAGGDIVIVDTTSYKTVASFKVNGRPRSVDFLPAGGIAFIPSESAGELNVVDTVDAKVLKTIKLPTGSRPMRVKVAADGKKLYVSNGRAGTISVLDARTYDILDEIKVGTRPWGIALSPDGKFLFVANGPSDDVSVVNLASDKEVARIKAGSSPWGLVVAQGAR